MAWNRGWIWKITVNALQSHWQPRLGAIVSWALSKYLLHVHVVGECRLKLRLICLPLRCVEWYVLVAGYCSVVCAIFNFTTTVSISHWSLEYPNIRLKGWAVRRRILFNGLPYQYFLFHIFYLVAMYSSNPTSPPPPPPPPPVLPLQHTSVNNGAN